MTACPRGRNDDNRSARFRLGSPSAAIASYHPIVSRRYAVLRAGRGRRVLTSAFCPKENDAAHRTTAALRAGGCLLQQVS